MALWDGRFEGGPSAEMQAFSESLDTDMLMWREDIAGSMAHVTMLGEVGLLTPDEAAAIREGLAKVEADLEAGWQPDIALEDIHIAVETKLEYPIDKKGTRRGIVQVWSSQEHSASMSRRKALARSWEL